MSRLALSENDYGFAPRQVFYFPAVFEVHAPDLCFVPESRFKHIFEQVAHYGVFVVAPVVEGIARENRDCGLPLGGADGAERGGYCENENRQDTFHKKMSIYKSVPREAKSRPNGRICARAYLFAFVGAFSFNIRRI